MSKKKPKLTGWFPKTTRPTRKGVYEVGYLEDGKVCDYPNPYGRWNGECFVGCGGTPTEAAESDYVSISLNESNTCWRGLAVKP